MENAVPGLHDIMQLCIGIAGVYLVVTVLQLMQLKRRVPLSPPVKEPSVGSRFPVERDDLPMPGKQKSFASQLEHVHLESELRRLHRSVAQLQDKLETTQREVAKLRTERATTNKTPQHSEAIILAQRGVDSALIASRCNISRSEAELVASLVRKERQIARTAEQQAMPQMDKRNDRQQQRQKYRAAA